MGPLLERIQNQRERGEFDALGKFGEV